MPGDLGSFQVSTEYKSLSFTGSLGSLVATLELCVVLAGNDTGMMEALIPEGGAPPLSNIPTDAALRQLVRREVRSFVSQPEVQQFLAMQHFATPGDSPAPGRAKPPEESPLVTTQASELHGSARALAPPAAGKLVASTGEGDSGSHLPQPQTVPGLCPGCHRRQGTFWRRPDEPASRFVVKDGMFDQPLESRERATRQATPSPPCPAGAVGAPPSPLPIHLISPPSRHHPNFQPVQFTPSASPSATIVEPLLLGGAGGLGHRR
jgi:hypothetical protein